MAKDCQQHHTLPGQSVAASSIHSPAGDLGITIKLDIVKVTWTDILTVTYSISRDKKKSAEDAEYLGIKNEMYTHSTKQHSNEVIRRKHYHYI